MANLPPNTVMSPHLFKKVAVPDICVDWQPLVTHDLSNTF
jgi:hypothetical protein